MRLFGSIVFSLTAVSVLHAAARATDLTNATLFRGDSNGNNLNGSGVVYYGAWTTVLDQQNIPGNYGAELFLATTATPTAADFLTPSAAASIPLHAGANTIYFWGDGDDQAGGTETFGMNLFFNGAGPTQPAISVYGPPGPGQPFFADSSPAWTAGYDFQLIPGTGTLSFSDGVNVITLSNFEVTGTGSDATGVDLVNSTNVAPFTPPPHPDGVLDTYGHFTLTVTPVPEPGTMGVMGAAGMLLMRRRRITTKARACRDGGGSRGARG